MKIIALNIWGGKVREPLLDFFKNNQEVDVFCLSEVWDAEEPPDRLKKWIGRETNPAALREIKESLPNHECYFSPAQDKNFGLTIFLRKGLEILNKGNIFVYRWEDAMENEDARTLGKNLQYVRLNLSGHPVTMANFHGLWTGAGKEDTEDRLEQSRNVKRFLDSVVGSKIICGDFNLLPTTKSMSIIEGGMRNLIEEFGVENTRSIMYDRDDKFADYMLISPDLDVLDFKVMEDVISDHLPLYLEVDHKL